MKLKVKKLRCRLRKPKSFLSTEEKIKFLFPSMTGILLLNDLHFYNVTSVMPGER
jgi:hypothetical protein